MNEDYWLEDQYDMIASQEDFWNDPAWDNETAEIEEDEFDER